MITKNQIIEDICRIKNEKNKISKRLYEKFGLYSTSTVNKLFGNWSDAVYESLGIQVTRILLPITMCINCGKETKNPRFCSSSCSASHNNKSTNGRKIGKKQKTYFCYICGESCKPRNKRCEYCKTKVKTNTGQYVEFNTLTKSQALTNDTQKYRRIRLHARIIAKRNKLLDKCYICGYNLYVECCHKSAIEDFSMDTLISIINDPNNLLGLCKNHHWEYDHILEFRNRVLDMLNHT